MAMPSSPVSDMLVTVKSREVQRGMLAEMRGDRAAASRHLLAAAHLELVLADDYAQASRILPYVVGSAQRPASRGWGRQSRLDGSWKRCFRTLLPMRPRSARYWPTWNKRAGRATSAILIA